MDNHISALPGLLYFDAENGEIPIDREIVPGGLEDALGVFYGEEPQNDEKDDFKRGDGELAKETYLNYKKNINENEKLNQEEVIIFKKSKTFKKKNLDAPFVYQKDYEREKNDLPNKHYYEEH